ncbi:VOC family protein [Labrenzia sp. PHM005]|uniref:VOC family protein n=1 Tax=Labrenzia sp. PHM005 TaxID=2590016 RepID=UPI001FFDE950|nr:VOC family protein [Labrenzia sp. PHM005]
MTRDVEKAKEFYGKSLGWTFAEMPMEGGGTYLIANPGEKPACGLFEMNGPDYEGLRDHWFSYIAVDNIDDRLALAKENGGEIVRPPFDVPGIGRIALLKDSSGAAQGWMTPA